MSGNEVWDRQEWVLFGCSLSPRSSRLVGFVPGHLAASVGFSRPLRGPGLALIFFPRVVFFVGGQQTLTHCPCQLGHSMSCSVTLGDIVLHSCTSGSFLSQPSRLRGARPASLRLFLWVSEPHIIDIVSWIIRYSGAVLGTVGCYVAFLNSTH